MGGRKSCSTPGGLLLAELLRLGESTAASTTTIKIPPAIQLHTAISFTGRTVGCRETYEFRASKVKVFMAVLLQMDRGA